MPSYVLPSSSILSVRLLEPLSSNLPPVFRRDKGGREGGQETISPSRRRRERGKTGRKDRHTHKNLKNGRTALITPKANPSEGLATSSGTSDQSAAHAMAYTQEGREGGREGRKPKRRTALSPQKPTQAKVPPPVQGPTTTTPHMPWHTQNSPAHIPTTNAQAQDP